MPEDLCLARESSHELQILDSRSSGRGVLPVLSVVVLVLVLVVPVLRTELSGRMIGARQCRLAAREPPDRRAGPLRLRFLLSVVGPEYP